MVTAKGASIPRRIVRVHDQRLQFESGGKEKGMLKFAAVPCQSSIILLRRSDGRPSINLEMRREATNE